MAVLFAKIREKLNKLGTYRWSQKRRSEVVHFLAQRQPLTHEEWHSRFAPEIPLDFICWFRDTCSRYFEFDLSAALPDDRLVEDLGMYRATWPDVDWDILEDYEDKFGAKIPSGEQSILTFGDFVRTLWKHANC